MGRLPGLPGSLSKRVSGRTLVPKQNRPLVRDGRLQAKKKRTDRSYLAGNGARIAVADEPELEAQQAPPEAGAAASESDAAQPEMSVAEADAIDAAEDAAVAEAMTPAGAVKAEPAPAAPSRAGRLPTAVRAMQQQGVRKRREFDVHALAVRDTRYAIHEMRRIFILSVMVIATLIVLGVVMR
jgi:hypothetical protein